MEIVLMCCLCHGVITGDEKECPHCGGLDPLRCDCCGEGLGAVVRHLDRGMMATRGEPVWLCSQCFGQYLLPPK